MPYIGKITDTSGSTGLIGSTLYGTCTTNANTAAKVGTLSAFDTLITGVTIHIKFTNTNTAANPTLNVNNTGAKYIYKAGTTAVGTTVDTSWADGAVVSLTYDGTAWIMNDHVDNTNITYSAGTGLSLSGTTFNHTDSITASSSPVFKKFKYNATGHITAVADVTATDLPAHTHTYAGSSSVGGPATLVKVTTLPTDYEASAYNLAFVEGTGGQVVFIDNNNGPRFRHEPGTTTDVGLSRIMLGNATASGTAGNAKGQLTLYSENTGHAKIEYASSTADSIFQFPAKTAGTYTVATTADINTYSAGTGLTLSGTTFNHTDSITEQTTTVFKKFKYNATGHITGVDAVTASDLPSHDHAYTVPPEQIAVKTGSSSQSHINLETLMTWLITTKGYIASGERRSLTLYTTWSYSNNDILQLTIGGNNYELHLAGVIIEFEGHATSYNNGVFRLRIHSAPTTNSFTPATGYTRFPLSHIAEYTCNGSGYSPTWKMIIDKDDITTGTTNGTIKVAGIAVNVYGLGSAAYTASTDYLPSTTTYAGSSSVGGAATSANKLNTDAGGLLDPVYFSNGIPVNDSGKSIPYIVGTGSTAGTWLGTLEGLTAYYDGLLILYKTPVAGASTTTLNINNLGAKTCYVNNTSKLTTHFPANQPVLLVYSTSQNSGCWMCLDDYWTDSNTYDRNRYNANIKAGTSALVAANIIVGKDGVYNHLKSGGAFDISYPILYNNAAVDASATTNNTYDIINFTITTTQSITLTSYLPVFIKGTLSGSIFTPVSATPLTQTIPTTADGYDYIYLGNATSTTAVYLTERHPIYAYKNGAFGEIVHTASNVNGYTVAKNVPSDAVFTDVSVTAVGNHYAPAEDSSAVISKDASSTTAATWNSTSFVTGIDVKRDAKGHVVDIALDSIKMPANPVPSNNVTGSGTSGYLVKFNGTNTITDGPQLGSSTTTFLRNDGTWATPTDTDTKVKVSAKTASDVAYLIGTTTSPAGTAVEGVADTGVYLDSTAGKLTTGSLQSNGDITLYDPSGDSPKLVFRRGNFTDTKLDWRIWDTGGTLHFDRSKNTSSETWETLLNLDPSAGKMYFNNTEVSLAGHTHTEYVQKTGDNMSGALSIAYTAFGALTLERKNAATAAAIYFKNSNGVLGAIGMTETANSGLYRWSADTNSRYKILDAGNTSFTQTLTSGTKIGSIKINDTSTDIYCADTKNTAGSTDTSSKIYLIGATSQAANPQTYSDNEVYTTSGVLTTKSVQVGGGSCTMQYNTTTQSLDFVFA